VGSPVALAQLGDVAEGDAFMGLFFLEVCGGWKKHKGLSSGLTAVGCFLHAVGKKTPLLGVLESVCFGHAFALRGPLLSACSAVR